MVEIRRFSGDSEIYFDITDSLRNRSLDQKFIYLGKGGEKYYEYDRTFWGNDSSDIVTTKDWIDFIKKNLKTINFNSDYFNLISIACGDSLKEKSILEGLGVKNINYIGVDFSESMIKLSEENLKNASFKSTLIRSDIVDNNFKRYLDTLVRKDEKRFFSFLGNTFGNIKTTNIVDLLGSYLKSGDIVGIDIAIKSSDSLKSSIELFNHYKEKTNNNELWRNYILNGFKNINFPIEKGKIIIETRENKFTGVYKIIFYLEMLEDVDFKLEGNVIISKGEKIKFYELYYYNPEKLKEFMKLHKFKFIDSNIKKYRGQFLFEKE